MERTEKLKCLKLIGLLIITNILMFSFFTEGIGGFLDNLIVAVYTVLIAFSLVGFILGTMVALLPFRKLPYKKKHLNAAVLSNLIIQVVFFVSLFWLGVVTIFDK